LFVDRTILGEESSPFDVARRRDVFASQRVSFVDALSPCGTASGEGRLEVGGDPAKKSFPAITSPEREKKSTCTEDPLLQFDSEIALVW
jgi:hypothetical protein